MRTTLTIDPDVAARLEAEVERSKISFKEAVNTALRRGLEARGGSRQPSRRRAARTFSAAFLPGIDPHRLNQLADDLETAAGASGLRR